MAYEISQFDLADRQLLTGSARPATRTCTEIGNAQITQSIFGKARIRIICAHDRIRRVRMLSTLLAITITIAIWQLTEYGEKLFGTPAIESVTATVQVSPPAFMPEYIPPSGASQRQGDLGNQTSADIYRLTTTRPAPPLTQNPANAAANPVVAPSSGTATPRTAPLASPLGSVDPKIPVAANPAPKPAVPLASTTQPMANKSAQAAPPPSPVSTATKPVVSPTQPAEPGSTEP